MYFPLGRVSEERVFQTKERISTNVSGRSFSGIFKRQKGLAWQEPRELGSDRKCQKGKECMLGVA